MNEIAEMLALPRSLSHCFHNRGTFGTLSHNVKAQYQYYFGNFDGNPCNLNPLPPVEESIRYMEYMGGTENVLKRAVASYEKGDFRWVSSVLKHVIFADPSNRTARALLARCFTQLGFQSESGIWRNFYLTGAQEIVGSVRPMTVPQTLNRDMIVAMSLSCFFDLFAVCVNGVKASTLPNSIFHIKLTDKIAHVVLMLSNGVLIPRINAPGSGPCSTIISAPRELFERIILRETSFRQALAEGKASVEGDLTLWCKVLDTLDAFNFWFNIVEP
jgi:alkyl sulfatase BDS1-like metallo-beta-lactamase superfamily hydrolase